MSDTTYNALVTLIIILAAIIAVILLGRALGGIRYSSLYLQPASTSIIYEKREVPRSTYHEEVVSYSKPSRPIRGGTSQYTTTEYQYQTSYVCPMDAMLCPDGSYVGRSGPSCQFYCPSY